MKVAAYQISQWVRIAWRLGWNYLTDAGDMPQKSSTSSQICLTFDTGLSRGWREAGAARRRSRGHGPPGNGAHSAALAP